MGTEKPVGTSARLTYNVGQTLDPLHLCQLAEEWHRLIHSDCPGREIESIVYEPKEWSLTVTFK